MRLALTASRHPTQTNNDRSTQAVADQQPLLNVNYCRHQALLDDSRRRHQPPLIVSRCHQRRRGRQDR